MKDGVIYEKTCFLKAFFNLENFETVFKYYVNKLVEYIKSCWYQTLKIFPAISIDSSMIWKSKYINIDKLRLLYQ